MKIFLVYFLSLVCTLSVLAQPMKQPQMAPELKAVLLREAKMDSMVKMLSAKQQSMIIEQEVTNSIISKSFDGVSLQLTGASTALAIIGGILTILVIGIGVYVTYVQYQVSSIYSKNKFVLVETSKIKSEVVELNKLIQSNVPKLYEQIKREEVVDVLNRLQKRPEDVVNHLSFLLTQTFIPADFEKLYNAFNRLLLTGTNAGVQTDMEVQYSMVLAQHFTFESMMKTDFKNEFLENLWLVLRGFYLQDMQDSLVGFGQYLKVKTVEKVREDIVKYFKAFEGSIVQNGSQIFTPMIKTLDKHERLALLTVFEENIMELPTVLKNYKICLEDEFPEWNR